MSGSFRLSICLIGVLRALRTSTYVGEIPVKSVLFSIVLLFCSASAFAEDRVLFLEYEFSRGDKVVSAPSLAVKEGAESSIDLRAGDSTPFSLWVIAETQEDGTVFLRHQIAHGEEEFHPAMIVKKGSEASIQVGDMLLKVTADDMEDDAV